MTKCQALIVRQETPMRSTSPLFKELILHIGSHKTGTSSIQSVCDYHRESLLEQGILYPATGQWTDKSHHHWARAIWHQDRYEITIEQLLIQLAQERELSNNKPDTVIISSELLEEIPLQSIRNLELGAFL